MHCQVDTNHWRRPTFWKYLAIRVCLDILRASSLMLFEGALIITIKEQVTIEMFWNIMLHAWEYKQKTESLYNLALTYYRRVETMDYKNFLVRLGRSYLDLLQDCSLM